MEVCAHNLPAVIPPLRHAHVFPVTMALIVRPLPIFAQQIQIHAITREYVHRPLTAIFAHVFRALRDKIVK